MAGKVWKKYGLYGISARKDKSELAKFGKETHCFACKKKFVKGDDKRKKCFDHDYYTGKYRSAMCNSCNRQCKDERRFPIFFHNFSGYDSHLLLRELNKIDNGDFTALPRNEEKFVSITKSFHVANQTCCRECGKAERKDTVEYVTVGGYNVTDWEIPPIGEGCDPIPKTRYVPERKIEKYVKKKYVHFDFKDSYSFCNGSLGSLAKNLKDEDFEPLKKEYGENYTLLTRKQVFPYRFLTGLKCMKYESLVPKEDFGSRLNKGDVFTNDNGEEIEVCKVISVISNRYAKANNPYNPYVKGYDEEMPTTYIVEYDANSLYASVMLEELPVGGFAWASNRDLVYLERMLKEGNNLPSGKGASLCVDLDYPKHLHDRDSDYPLAAEKVINGVMKLAPNLGNKRKYHTTYELLLYYMKKGLVLKKVHSAITYMTSNFLKSYIEFCAGKRAEAKGKGDKFGDVFWKLAGNSVYGKTFESVRDRCNTQFVGSEQREKLTKLFSKPNFISATVLCNSNIVMVRMGKTIVSLNKTPFLGACILDKSKRVMYEFYDYFKQKWKNSSLLFTDTDLLTFWVETKDVYKEMIPDLEKRFDTSNYPENHPSGIPKGINAGKIGDIFKDDMGGKPIAEFVGLAAKRYCIRMEKSDIKRNKGVPTDIVSEKIGFEHYYDCLTNNSIYYSKFVRFTSREHIITTDLVKKEALSAYDDKRMLIHGDPLHRTLPWFHKDIPESLKSQCDDTGDVKVVNTSVLPELPFFGNILDESRGGVVTIPACTARMRG